MFGSVRARILAVTLATVVLAIAATTWLVATGTKNRLQDDVELGLEVDGRIYLELTGYALSHPGWTGVESLVSELGRSTRRRVALTTPEGRLIADSDVLLGKSAQPLPDRPAAVIDPLLPALALAPLLLSESAAVEALAPRAPLRTRELDARRALLRTSRRCLDRKGVAYETVPNFPTGVDIIFVDPRDPAAVAVYGVCVDPDALYGPATAERGDMPAGSRRIAACLRDAGAGFATRPGPGGIDVPAVSPNDRVTSLVLAGCLDRPFAGGAAGAIGLQPASRALLFLGYEAETGLRVGSAFSLRTLAVVLIVVASAVAFALVASRRLTKPVTELTAAARRMAGGDLEQRVAQPGRGEVGELAIAFNVMAESLASNADARRRLIDDVAHELRNPLVTISGLLEATQDGVEKLTPELVDTLADEIRHLGRLVDDLQELALGEAGQLRLDLEPIDLSDPVGQVIEALRPQAQADGIELVFSRNGPAPVTGDAARLRQVVANLVANALGHTPAGGMIDVTVQATGGWAEIEVRDTGCGIEPEHLPHIFERMYRADPSRARETGGHGLGLAIAQQLVRAHGGEISVESIPGRGSTFTARIPATTSH